MYLWIDPQWRREGLWLCFVVVFESVPTPLQDIYIVRANVHNYLYMRSFMNISVKKLPFLLSDF